MAYSNTTPLLLIAMAVAILGLCQDLAQAQQCPGLDIGGLITECRRYVQKTGPKIPPSTSCCALVKKIDVPCACKFVNKDIENLVNVDKAVYVARYCGVALKPGFKCGSYTVPPPTLA